MYIDIYIRVLISAVLLVTGMTILCKRKIFDKLNIITILLMSALMSFLVVEHETIGGVISVIILIIHQIIRKNTVVRSIVSTVIVMLVSLFSDSLVCMVLELAFEFETSVLELADSNLLFYAAICTVIGIVDFSLLYLLSGIFTKSKTEIVKSRVFEILLAVISIIMFAAFYAIVRTMDGNNQVVNLSIYLICYTAFIIAMIILYRYSKKDLQLRAREKEQERLLKYTSELEVLINELNRMMHENNNIMLTMAHYINSNDMEQLSEYFNEKIVRYNDSHVVDESNLKALSHIMQPEIKSLVYCKVIEAHTKGLNPILDVYEDITIENIDILDLSSILGILIDNAMEGALKSEKPDVRLGLVIREDTNLIIVANSCPDDMPPIYKMFDDRFSTKSRAGKGHGLANLLKIIRKYSNVYLRTEASDNVISQCVEVMRFKENADDII